MKCACGQPADCDGEYAIITISSMEQPVARTIVRCKNPNPPPVEEQDPPGCLFPSCQFIGCIPTCGDWRV